MVDLRDVFLRAELTYGNLWAKSYSDNKKHKLDLAHMDHGFLDFPCISLVRKLLRPAISDQKNCWALCGQLGMLVGCCKFLWRKDCNGTRFVLKRRVTASRRIQNFEKRLITFGDTAWNVQIFFRLQKLRGFLEIRNFYCQTLLLVAGIPTENLVFP